MGFGQGLSGLKGASQKLDVIGNNIANSGTVGFKSSSVSFADVYASSRVGLGTQVAAINQNFGVGNISTTGGQFDMAIDGDRGLFRVVDSSGQVMYTRNGEFSVSKDGYLTNPQGYFLTGFVGESTTPERIRVPYGNIAPQATSSVGLSSNFDANSPVVTSSYKERRGWIELSPAGDPNAEPTRYYYVRELQGDGSYEQVWTDHTGEPLADNPAAGSYRSGNRTVEIDANGVIGYRDADNDLIAGIPSGAVAQHYDVPTGGPIVGTLTTDDTPPTTHYFTRSQGGLVWTNAIGEPLADKADWPSGSITSGGETFIIDGDGQLDGLSDFPEGAKYTAPLPQPLAFDPLVPDSYTHSLPMTVYDSLGNSHQLTQYFVKREAEGGNSVWNAYYRLDGRPIDDSMFDGAQELTFDSAGRLVSPTGPLTVSFSLEEGGSPAETLSFTIDYAGSTQFGGGFTPDFVQNGYSTGEYASLGFSADGSIVANYTNGEMMKTGTIALAHFNNLQGLSPVGGNAWIETSDSGPAILGTPGQMGFSTIKGQALEESNVDMGTELVNMIITQRVYQANAQTITTQSEMMQTLMNMR